MRSWTVTFTSKELGMISLGLAHYVMRLAKELQKVETNEKSMVEAQLKFKTVMEINELSKKILLIFPQEEVAEEIKRFKKKGFDFNEQN